MTAMRIPFALFMMWLLLLAAGCEHSTEPAPAPSGTAATGTAPAIATREAVSTEPAAVGEVNGARVISTVPAATLQLVQLGAVDSLVGVSTFDRLLLPQAKQTLPIVGDYLTFNYETIVGLHPTAMVVQIADERLAPRLKEIAGEHHIELVNVKLDTLDDMVATARRLGKITGREGAAEVRIARVRGNLAAIQAKLADLPRPKVVYIIFKKPLAIVGGRGFMNEVIGAAGGTNVGGSVNEYFPEITREELIKMAPDVILIAAPEEPAARTLDDPRLADWLAIPTPAGKTGRIFLVTSPNAQLNSLDFDTETLLLAKIIHPEIRDWTLTAPAGSEPRKSSAGGSGK